MLVYCGPPYILGTRYGKQYRHEMDDKDHEALLDALLRHSGYAAVSGYETDLYNSMLAGWNRYRATSYSQVCSKKQEILWTNYEPPGMQLSFGL